MMSNLENNFKYHPPKTEETIKAHEAVRENCKNLAETLSLYVAPSRELSLALTKIEEAMFWANAGIARN